MTKYRAVEVEWIDAMYVGGGWQTAAKAIKSGKVPAKVVTRGFLIHRDAKSVIVSQTLAADGDVFGAQVIPSAFLRKVRFK